nr:hypothetical protein CFP56_37094 [Quercus suber]
MRLQTRRRFATTGSGACDGGKGWRWKEEREVKSQRRGEVAGDFFFYRHVRPPPPPKVLARRTNVRAPHCRLYDMNSNVFYNLSTPVRRQISSSESTPLSSRASSSRSAHPLPFSVLFLRISSRTEMSRPRLIDGRTWSCPLDTVEA